LREFCIVLLFSVAAIFHPAAQAGSLGGALGGIGKALGEIADKRQEEEREKELIRYRYELERQAEVRREARRIDAENRQRDTENKQREAENQKAEQDRREKKANEVSIGSGFFVTSDGYFVTNYHVIKNSKSITLRTTDGKTIEAQISRSDVTNDLVLLKAEGMFAALPVTSSRTAKKGQAVATFGYPHADIQGIEAKVTEGIVSSISGISGDPRTFQISVPIQSGNSGGPLVTKEGNVIGIIVSKLSAAFMLKQTGDVTQNVNYAIKSNYLLELLDAANLERKLLPVSKKSYRSLEDITAIVEKATALVVARPIQTATTVQFTPATPSPSIAPPIPANSLDEESLPVSVIEAYQKGGNSNSLEVIRGTAYDGYPPAQVELGLLWLEGKSGQKTKFLDTNESEAFVWFKKAADKNYPPAFYLVGLAYEFGSGVNKDIAIARDYYSRAAQNGYKKAESALSRLIGK